VHRQDEVGELANSLNEMSERLKTYENEISENSRLAAIGKTAARVAHEIRNPLTAIKMNVQLMGETNKDNKEDQAQTITALLDEIRRLELIVSGTLQQNQGQKTPLKLARNDLNQIINEVVNLMAPQFNHRKILIKSELSEALPLANLDTDKVKQILLNLLLNAADAMPTGGNIMLSSYENFDNNEIHLLVEDSGPGIPLDQREHLFSANISNKPGGFGLGLLLCKELMQMHRGKISVDESKLGGASFHLIFPLEV
jgi:signal transduction histidine kinase